MLSKLYLNTFASVTVSTTYTNICTCHECSAISLLLFVSKEKGGSLHKEQMHSARKLVQHIHCWVHEDSPQIVCILFWISLKTRYIELKGLFKLLRAYARVWCLTCSFLGNVLIWMDQCFLAISMASRFCLFLDHLNSQIAIFLKKEFSSVLWRISSTECWP